MQLLKTHTNTNMQQQIYLTWTVCKITLTLKHCYYMVMLLYMNVQLHCTIMFILLLVAYICVEIFYVHILFKIQIRCLTAFYHFELCIFPVMIRWIYSVSLLPFLIFMALQPVLITKSIPWKITCILWFVINQNKKLKAKYFPAIKRIKPTLQSKLRTRTNKIKELIRKSKHGLMNVNLSLDPACHFTSKRSPPYNPFFSTSPHHYAQLQIQIDAFFIFRDVRSEYSGVSSKGEKMC